MPSPASGSSHAVSFCSAWMEQARRRCCTRSNSVKQCRSNSQSTVGFNIETFRYKNVEFIALDIDGQSALRLRWGGYVENSDAVIFVVDATDRPRIFEGAKELNRAFTFEELRSAKLLVYTNKQDQLGCMTIHEIQERLKLDEVTKNLHHIQAMSAISGKGIYEELNWLSQHV